MFKVDKRIRNIFHLCGHYFRFNLSAGMAYRAAFLTQVFGMFLNNAMFIVFWLIIFDRVGGAIKGYEFRDIMFLWSLAATGVGVAQVFFGNSHHISRVIYSGELDVYILQPKPVVLNLIISRTIVSGWGDIVYGVALYFVSQPISPYSFAMFLLFSILLAFVFTALRVLYHSLTFFLGNAESFAGLMAETTISFMLYPGSIFKGPALWILHSLIPVAFVAYLPARIIKDFDPLLLIVVLVADLAIVGISLIVFLRGMRRYESGNKIVTRL